MVQQSGDWAGRSPPRPSAHPSTANVPITVLLCNGPSMLCGVKVPIIKGFKWKLNESLVMTELVNE